MLKQKIERKRKYIPIKLVRNDPSCLTLSACFSCFPFSKPSPGRPATINFLPRLELRLYSLKSFVFSLSPVSVTRTLLHSRNIKSPRLSPIVFNGIGAAAFPSHWLIFSLLFNCLDPWQNDAQNNSAWSLYTNNSYSRDSNLFVSFLDDSSP